jgi:MerR family transcriptional regulator, redox-sensitive transcriptional activator SoxR
VSQVEEEESLLSIGEVAAASGLRPSALRYYEEEGLISPTARVGGRRHYHPSALRRLAIIALLKEVGFTVAEIGDLLGQQRTARQRWRKLAEAKLEEIEAHIERAQTTRRLLQAVLACGCGDPASCDMVTEAGQRRLLSVGLRDGMATPTGKTGSTQPGRT